MKNVLGIALMASLVVSSCGQFNKKDKEADDSSKNPTGEASGQGSNDASQGLSIEGSWQNEKCEFDEGDKSGMKEERVISKDRYSIVAVSFSDTTCMQAQISTSFEGPIADLKDSAISKDAKEFRVNLSEAKVTIHEQATLNAMNAIGFCGKSDWQLNTAFVVTNDSPNCIPVNEPVDMKVIAAPKEQSTLEIFEGTEIETKTPKTFKKK